MSLKRASLAVVAETNIDFHMGKGRWVWMWVGVVEVGGGGGVIEETRLTGPRLPSVCMD